MHMDVSDIDAKLEDVSKRLKEGEARAKASEVIQRNSPKKVRAQQDPTHLDLQNVPTFGSRISLVTEMCADKFAKMNEIEPIIATATSPDDSLFAHLEKQVKVDEDCDIVSDNSDSLHEMSRQPRQSDLFQQGTV